MSLISRQAIALALLAMTGTAASAQAPLPFQAPHLHRPAPLSLSSTDAPVIKFGRSTITAPRSGSGASAGPLVPYIAGASRPQTPLLAVGDLWTATGPGPLQNAGGAFGSDMGQNVSGRIVGVAADPTDANTYYIAAAGGGIWKTTNGGQSYKALTDFLGDTAMGSIAVAPSNHNVIYAGTGEANYAQDSRYGIGVLKSTDGGASWSVIPGPSNVFYRNSISRIVISPTDSNTVYLTTVLSGLNGNGGYGGGVWKTTDGGATWTNTTTGKLTGVVTATGPEKMPDVAIYNDVVMNSKNPNILYTSTGLYFAYPGNGIFKSINGGTTWTRLTGGLPLVANGDPVGGQTTLALSPSADGTADTLYVSVASAGTAAANYQDSYSLLGLYKSSDSGATFTNLHAPNYLGGQGFYDNALIVSPTNPNVFFAAGQVNYAAVGGFGTVATTNYNDLRNLVGTTDGGATFHDFSLGGGLGGPHTDTHALAFTADGKLLDGNDGGLWRLENPLVANPTPPTSSTDMSSNIQWSDINGNLNTIQFTGIALDPSDAGTAYGGAQDNGTSKLFAGGWNQIIGGDGGFTHVDASNPQTVYQEFYGISLDRSDDGGQNFYTIYSGIYGNAPGSSFNPPSILSRVTGPSAFYVPYKLDLANPAHVLYGTSNVYFSPDKGGDVNIVDANGVGGDFKAIGTVGMNGYNPPTVDANGYATYVDALGVAGPVVYVEMGTHVFATFNNGVNWYDRSIPATLNGGNPLSDFYVNTVDSLDVYATKPAFDDSSAGKIFRSTDGGLTWNDITGNLPDIPFNAVKLDQKSGVLYVGGDDGVYSSTDFGGSWSRIPGSLPTVAVVDLDISNPTNLLGAGTHGRGLWTTPLSTVVAKPNLKLVPTVTRLSANTIQVRLTLSNFGSASFPAGVGSADVANAALNVTLNGKTAAPVVLGSVPAYGNSQSATVTFTNIPAGYASLRYSGTYTGSSFSGTQRVSVP